tara:strand:+ start:1063 stop:3615 length:2553 start_codon:yes stop_codon:yes gene_type:complete
MKYLYLVLIKCCLCINITKDVHYLKNGDHLVRHDLTSWTTQSKQEFVRINKHDLYEEVVYDDDKIPITRNILVRIKNENVLTNISKVNDITKYTVFGKVVHISLDDCLDFASTVMEIESITGVENVNVLNYMKPDISGFNDPAFATYQQNLFHVVGHPYLWSFPFLNGYGVDVIVTDNNIDMNHEDLPNIDFPESVQYNQTLSMIDKSHGTHVTGILSAIYNNQKGIVGFSSGVNVEFYSFMLLNSALDTVLNILNKHIDYSSVPPSPKDRIISTNSWGPVAYYNIPYYSSLRYNYEEIINNMRNGKGAILVFASGNNRDIKSAHHSFFHTFKDTIVVGSVSTNQQNQLYSSFFSEEGSCLTISAPGQSILSTLPNNQYGYSSGTSMATPIVSSAIAMILQVRPSFTNKDIKQLLMKSASKNVLVNKPFITNAAGFSFSNSVGAGVLDMTRLIGMAATWTPLGTEFSFEYNLTSGLCSDVCVWAYDNYCDDGGLNSMYADCQLGSDCSDCGVRNNPWIKSYFHNTNTLSFTRSINENKAIHSIQVNMKGKFKWYQNFEIEVKSPSGTRSILSEVFNPYGYVEAEHFGTIINETRIQNHYRLTMTNPRSFNYNTDYSFTTNAFLDEMTQGLWNVTIKYGNFHDRCDDSCGRQNGVCEDKASGIQIAQCESGTDCTDCGTALTYQSPLQIDSEYVEHIKLIINGFERVNPITSSENSPPPPSPPPSPPPPPSLPPPPSPHLPCPMLTIIETINKTECTDFLTQLHSITTPTKKQIDFLCYCTDSLPNNYHETPDCFILGNNTMNHVLQTCRSRIIQINPDDLSNYHKECCGTDCWVYVNYSHYTTNYETSII